MFAFDPLSYCLPITVLGFSLVLLRASAPGRYAPAGILLLVWIGVFLLHGLAAFFQIVPIYPIGMSGSLVLTAAVFSLCWSIVFFTKAFLQFSKRGAWTASPVPDPPQDHGISGMFLLFMVCYSLGALLYFYLVAMRIVGSGNVLGSLQLLRTNINYGGASWGFAGYAATPVTVFSAYALVVSSGKGHFRRLGVYTIILCAIAIAILSTQRTSFFMLLIVLAFASSRNGIPPLRTLVNLFIGMVIAFALIGALVGKIAAEGADVSSFLTSMFEAIVYYFITPLSAFDASRVWEVSTYDAGYVLRFFQ